MLVLCLSIKKFVDWGPAYFTLAIVGSCHHTAIVSTLLTETIQELDKVGFVYWKPGADLLSNKQCKMHRDIYQHTGGSLQCRQTCYEVICFCIFLVSFSLLLRLRDLGFWCCRHFGVDVDANLIQYLSN